MSDYQLVLSLCEARAAEQFSWTIGWWRPHWHRSRIAIHEMCRTSRRFAIALLATALATASCSAIPRDSHGALDRVRGGVLRAGVVEHPPWTVVDDHTVTGSEAHLLEGWASQLRARVVWRAGDLDTLVEALHRREIDVLAAGLQQNTPYAAHLALSQPHTETQDASGKKQRFVLAVTPGESALLFDLDRFLTSRDQAHRP
jgi:polar amino acid transport system substrate-binding protein